MSAAAPGFFGKLPGAGDFVQRRIPPAFLDVWDRGFSRAVVESRDRLGARWNAFYAASPVWRFLLSPGLLGEGAWAGVLGPGCDRVGRCFPMTIGVRLPGGTAQPGVLHDGGRWFVAAERVLRTAQAERWSVDAFDAQVAALAVPPDPDTPSIGAFPRDLDPRRRNVWLALGETASPLPATLWAALAPAGCALWWTRGRLLLGAGLPGGDDYAEFLAPGAGATDDTTERRVLEALP
ncbi:type VI secretion system-associated protein TagF [Coralloluteibacterium thermophilus]|uniref:Type VI secretion system-associated protein TagF n=1 Tax=Coralloluteibacterium thermophilum TaxID=2707049 RepID=A0ABV9NQP7_9GAMM